MKKRGKRLNIAQYNVYTFYIHNASNFDIDRGQKTRENSERYERNPRKVRMKREKRTLQR